MNYEFDPQPFNKLKCLIKNEYTESKEVELPVIATWTDPSMDRYRVKNHKMSTFFNVGFGILRDIRKEIKVF